MTVYEDVFFHEQFVDDAATDVTCRMCGEDCLLSFLVDGSCPGCSSLCQSAPAQKVDTHIYHAHLVSLTRHAFLLWDEACSLCVERETALHPSADCIEEAVHLVQHRLRRLKLLESRLADATGLDTSSVYNSICQYPSYSRLLNRSL